MRQPGKDFRQRRPDGKGGWTWNAKGVPPLIYRLPEVREAIKSRRTVFVTEGEKDADRLAGDGLTATCNPGGALKWKPQHSAHLHGAHVVILPDNDDPGRKHAQQVAASLQGQARSVRVANLPGLPKKGDVSDWLDADGSVDNVERIAASTSEWSPSHETVDSSCTVPLTPSVELEEDAHSEQVAQDRGPRMIGKWSKSGVPKRGWTCTGVKDLGAPCAVCGMCETRQIRYVHCMEHPEYPGEIEAGCVCAEHMEKDGQAARTRSKEIKNLARRRRNWLHRKWKLSPDGSSHIKTRDGYHIVVFLTKNDKWSAKITSMDGDQCDSLKIFYDTQEKAKMAAFDYIYYRNG